MKGVQAYDCPRCGEPCPTPTGHLRCGEDAATSEDKVIGKIRKLLALAEGTNHEGEAATAWAKAQELMTRHAVDEALLRREDADGSRAQVVTRAIPFRKRQQWRARKMELLSVVAGANRVRVIDSRHEFPEHARDEVRDLRRRANEAERADRWEEARELHNRLHELRREEGVAYLVGLASDVSFVELLYLSVQLQAWRFMLAGVKAVEQRRRPSFGLAFLAGFNGRVARRLAEQNRETERDAQRREDARVDTPDAIEPRSVALALRDTRRLVDEEVAARFGKLHRSRGPGRVRDGEGYAAGQVAGAEADLSGGRGSLGGSRKELGE